MTLSDFTSTSLHFSVPPKWLTPFWLKTKKNLLYRHFNTFFLVNSWLVGVETVLFPSDEFGFAYSDPSCVILILSLWMCNVIFLCSKSWETTSTQPLILPILRLVNRIVSSRSWSDVHFHILKKINWLKVNFSLKYQSICWTRWHLPYPVSSHLGPDVY